MLFNEKLKKMRQNRKLTQEAVAEQLGVSAQTVSKWERGLLSPDIMLLPKIAVLYRCSIDSIFDMESSWSVDHREIFRANLRQLHAQNDYEGVYRALITEIELKPDEFVNYTELMLFVLQHKMLDNDRVNRIVHLADYAQRYCFDDDIRNEIYRLMLQICSLSDAENFQKKAKEYYFKLPMLKHSREIYAKFVMKDADYHNQIKKNIIYTVDLAECAIRQLIVCDMPPQEKLYYYRKSAALYEVILDGDYGGLYDIPLLSDYVEIVSLYMEIGDFVQAERYVDRITQVLEKQISADRERSRSKLMSSDEMQNIVPIEINLHKVLNRIITVPQLAIYKERFLNWMERYNAYRKAK